jgi:hypothetical protein
MSHARAKKAPGSTAKAGTKPATVTGSAVDLEVKETTDIDSGPAAEDLADVEVEEILAETEEAQTPSGAGVHDVVLG